MASGIPGGKNPSEIPRQLYILLRVYTYSVVAGFKKNTQSPRRTKLELERHVLEAVLFFEAVGRAEACVEVRAAAAHQQVRAPVVVRKVFFDGRRAAAGVERSVKRRAVLVVPPFFTGRG